MKIIYRVSLLCVVTAFIAAYVIKIDVSSSARGIIRSEQENVVLNTVISGKIQFIQLRNNQKVQKGDTLVIIEDDPFRSSKPFKTRFAIRL